MPRAFFIIEEQTEESPKLFFPLVEKTISLQHFWHQICGFSPYIKQFWH